MIVMDHNCTSLLACYSSGEVARSSGQFLQWQPSKTALDDLWPMMSGHSSSAINEVQFLVEPLGSTGCQCTTSAVLVSFNGSCFR
ncbi:uncharacterized protein [Dysidea avara]|uniref:uncharacterized protein isoform X2 n=1 Tax=Dysidea avara TaxID=196820 RepID=UPI00333456BC